MLSMKRSNSIFYIGMVISILVVSIFVIMPRSTAGGKFSVNPSQTLSYSVLTNTPNLYPYKHYAITITASNATGVYANFTLTNITNGKENYTNLQCGWTIDSSDIMGSELNWMRLLDFEFLIFPQNSWDEVQRLMFQLPYNLRDPNSVVNVINIEDEVVPFLGAFRWLKTFQITVTTVAPLGNWPDHYTELNISTYHFEFDYSGILLRLTNKTDIFNYTSGWISPYELSRFTHLKQISTTYQLDHTTVMLSFAIPPSIVYFLLIGAVALGLIILIHRLNRVKTRKPKQIPLK